MKLLLFHPHHHGYFFPQIKFGDISTYELMTAVISTCDCKARRFLIILISLSVSHHVIRLINCPHPPIHAIINISFHKFNLGKVPGIAR